jgi:hypothetical protein
LGTAVFIVAVFYISWSTFGSRRPFDAVLRLRLPADPTSQRRLVEVLQGACTGITLVELAKADGALQDHVYHLRLADPGRKVDLLRDLTVVPGVEGVHPVLTRDPRWISDTCTWQSLRPLPFALGERFASDDRRDSAVRRHPGGPRVDLGGSSNEIPRNNLARWRTIVSATRADASRG